MDFYIGLIIFAIAMGFLIHSISVAFVVFGFGLMISGIVNWLAEDSEKSE